jgi:hypothetical protein
MGFQEQDDDGSRLGFREPSPGEDADYPAYLAWEDRERAAGREYEPAPWEIEGPAVSISLGDACDLDPALLAALAAHTLGDRSVNAQWAQDKAADALRPGPILAALTAQAVPDAGRLSDDELLGALGAARKLENHAAAQQTVLIAEFTRRRLAQREEALARGLPEAWRPGRSPDAELAMELTCSINYASDLMDETVALTTRLPATFAGLWDGIIDYGRALIIYRHTQFLSDADAAHADAILASAAPHLRHDQLQRKAAALEMKLDPEAVRRRRERAAKDGRRVEYRRERSGNAAIAGRELAVEVVLAAKAHIDAVAVALRKAGVPGTLQHLRARVLTELLQGRDPLDLIGRPAGERLSSADPDAAPPADGPAPSDPDADRPADLAGPGDPGASVPVTSDPGACAPGTATADAGLPADGFPDNGYIREDDPDSDEDEHAGDGDATPRGAAPVPATINLLVPVGNLFGWPTAPAQAGGWGLLDANQIRDLLQAASRHPATRWCWTLLNPDGTAAAHACVPGRHPWPPPDWPPPDLANPEDPSDPANPGGGRDGPALDHPRNRHGPALGSHGGSRDEPTPEQAVLLAAFLARLGGNLRPIARGSCDHAHAEGHYTPSRKLKHLIQARTATCPAPGCDAQACRTDADHTIPWPAGPTDECNLSPPCRRHHRAKQSPGWQLTQPEPGLMRWQTPSGRVYTTTPTVYDT